MMGFCSFFRSCSGCCVSSENSRCVCGCASCREGYQPAETAMVHSVIESVGTAAMGGTSAAGAVGLFGSGTAASVVTFTALGTGVACCVCGAMSCCCYFLNPEHPLFCPTVASLCCGMTDTLVEPSNQCAACCSIPCGCCQDDRVTCCSSPSR